MMNTNTLSQLPLVGTWKLKIDRSNTNLPPFLALHTYFADGTMTETTSELGKGGEGPGHGVWQGQVPVFRLRRVCWNRADTDHNPPG
jgi:hypothetical protein